MPDNRSLYSSRKVAWVSRGEEHEAMQPTLYQFRATQRILRTAGRKTFSKVPNLSAPESHLEQDAEILLQEQLHSTPEA